MTGPPRLSNSTHAVWSGASPRLFSPRPPPPGGGGGGGVMGEPRVVIVGGGFGGLTAAKALARAPVRVTLVDRTNHHLFQPLLYQVASAGLSPADIASPIRSILARQRNVEVQLATVTAIDPARKRVVLSDGEIPYDFLILAA